MDAMRRAAAYGLILLAAYAAPALARAPQSDAGGRIVLFFLSGATTTARTQQGYLGIDIRDVTDDQLATLKLKEARGAEIVLVDHDAPAGKAGLREHDVVLQLNGQPIEGQEQLRRILHESPPGRAIQLVISRDGQQITVTTQMSTREEVDRLAWEQHLTAADPQAPQALAPENTDPVSPSPTISPAARTGNSFIGTLLMSPSYTGAMLEQMSTQLADFFGVSSGIGLLVRSVEPNSPAAVAGMRAGDVVLRANANPVASNGDWARAIKNCHGQPISIVIMRDKQEHTLSLRPDSKKR